MGAPSTCVQIDHPGLTPTPELPAARLLQLGDDGSVLATTVDVCGPSLRPSRARDVAEPAAASRRIGRGPRGVRPGLIYDDMEVAMDKRRLRACLGTAVLVGVIGAFLLGNHSVAQADPTSEQGFYEWIEAS
jgi:hypothetical protein